METRVLIKGEHNHETGPNSDGVAMRNLHPSLKPYVISLRIMFCLNLNASAHLDGCSRYSPSAWTFAVFGGFATSQRSYLMVRGVAFKHRNSLLITGISTSGATGTNAIQSVRL